MDNYDVVIVGAGAAGMMCAIEAGKRGRSVLVIDHAKAPGEKIRISGGGRCNFTNTRTEPKHFLSANPKFAISALRRYRPTDFIALVDRHHIAWHEKALGQLFCDDSARQIVAMLLEEMEAVGAQLRLETSVTAIDRTPEGFRLIAGGRTVVCSSLVMASGGKSIPKMGATGFAYEVATKYGVPVIETRPALVPLTFDVSLLERLRTLAGVAVDARVSSGPVTFEEAMLFTHRGISGPAILQISSYWREGGEIEIDMAPGTDVFELLREARRTSGKQAVATVLSRILPKSLANHIAVSGGAVGNIADANDALLRRLAGSVNAWRVKPVGSEGYRTAEVTLGGIDTDVLDSRTMAVKAVPGLYFIGEAVDVTGWLGGYNFQWAWASGWCAGQAV
jgi:predicted Rossmann fold flavoprotein